MDQKDEVTGLLTVWWNLGLTSGLRAAASRQPRGTSVLETNRLEYRFVAR
jgi:hypothetical protein